MDFLDALAQTAVGVIGLALLNRYAGGEDWPHALVFASLFMVCFWLGQFAAERLPRRASTRQRGRGSMTVQDQLALLRRGTAEIISEEELGGEAAARRADRPAAAGQAGHRPDRAGHPPRVRRGPSEAAAVPGPGARGDRHHRRLHRDDRRPDRQDGDPAAAHRRGSAPERPHLREQYSKILDPERTRVVFNSQWLGPDELRGRGQAHFRMPRSPRSWSGTTSPSGTPSTARSPSTSSCTPSARRTTRCT